LSELQTFNQKPAFFSDPKFSHPLKFAKKTVFGQKNYFFYRHKPVLTIWLRHSRQKIFSKKSLTTIFSDFISITKKKIFFRYFFSIFTFSIFFLQWKKKLVRQVKEKKCWSNSPFGVTTWSRCGSGMRTWPPRVHSHYHIRQTIYYPLNI